MCGCAGGFGGGGGGGGGTGNLSGNLTVPFIPVASGLHALVDSALEWVDADSLFRITVINLSIDDELFSYGSVFTLDHDTGNISVGAIQAGGMASLDGGIEVNTDKFQVDQATGNTAVGGTLAVDDLANLNGGIAVDTDKFTVDGTTGDVVVKGTTDLKEQVTVEKSTILGIKDLAIVAGEVDIDADDADQYYVELTADFILNAPINPRVGRRFLLCIRVSGAGAPLTITWDEVFVFPGYPGSPPVPDATLLGYYYIGFVWRSQNSRWHAVGPMTEIYASA